MKTPNQPLPKASVARDTSPSYANRVLYLVRPDESCEVCIAPTEKERDQFISDLVQRGLRLVHLHCENPECACTFPVLLDDGAGRPAEPPATWLPYSGALSVVDAPLIGYGAGGALASPIKMSL